MEQSICQRMAELRLICDREIPIQQQRANKTMISFQNFLQSVRLNAEQASQNKVKNGELKVYIRQLEDDLVKALSGIYAKAH
ncbi:hypothetical protein GIB67_021073 [Kingdonia uniflora]|uniref:Uncharacterized protein n=1 Tax=Kingdonia uniflora TaxID=39325 RepID=A0A7J7N7C3_9MAGN|nr:hypothetical protein GIB67_021073 [Kingdonia uniflora]